MTYRFRLITSDGLTNSELLNGFINEFGWEASNTVGDWGPRKRNDVLAA